MSSPDRKRLFRRGRSPRRRGSNASSGSTRVRAGLLLVLSGGCLPSFEGLTGGAPLLDATSETTASSDGGTEEGAAADAEGGLQIAPDLLPPNAPNQGIYLCWLFDAASTMAADSSGNGRDGFLINMPSPSDPAPAARVPNLHGLFLNGGGQAVSYVGDAKVDAFTVSLWVKPALSDSALVFARESSGGLQSMMALRLSSSHFELFANDGSVGAGCADSGSCVIGTTAVAGDNWYHLAASVESNGSMHLFVNGLEEGGGRPIQTVRIAGDRYDLGAETGRAEPGFRGIVDEVLIYDWVLPPTAIAKLGARKP
jgi:hypothetical protein